MPAFRPWHSVLLLTLVFCASPVLAADQPALQLNKGDSIAIIGNTLADRMQHFGHFETRLHARFPQHELTVRNLGFSGDELKTRLRSAGFGSPDDHLNFVHADVILAMFGYNESYAGPAGLDQFKQDLTDFIKHTLAQKYNGRSAPRLVLFSPITHENLHDRNLPDGSANNARLKLYTAAMADVAKANQVAFVDLLTPTAEVYRTADRPLTINGVHLNEYGDQQLARIMERALFASGGEPPRDAAQFERLRQAVNDKNFYWFERYRTTDGYSIFGGRADLKFVNDQTNRVVMQREMEVLNAMTINRDKRVWAIAGGSDLRVDDSNTPPFIDVITNKPGPLPGGKHVFLSGEEAITKMKVADGMKVNLVASEEDFPELINPVQMAFDTKGRLWVATWESYPHWKPKDEMNDRLLILEDTNGDGKADKCTTFADHLHNPTGFEFWGGGVLVAMTPDLLFIKDTNGDDKADVRTRVISGLDSADTHHASNSFTLDPGGALYFQEGTFHHSQVETPYTPSVRLANAGVFRYEPRTQKFDVYVSYGFANPHGHAFDHWGQDIIVDGTGAVPYHGALFSGHVDFPQKHGGTPTVYKPRTRPCSGIEYLSSRHFPDAMQGNLLVANVIGFQGILRYKIDDKGASQVGTELDPILSSSDINFRPADMEVGPDGAIYFTDWQNPIIGHMQHNLRDPSRDRLHGRVYRVTYPERPLLKPVDVAGQPIDKLLDLLKEPEDRVRYRVKIELSGRDSQQVMAALDKWVRKLDPKDPQYQHLLLEALWLHQAHNVVDIALLDRVLASPDFRARAAAARVLCVWRDQVSDSLERFKRLASDEHPRVRLEAERAASFYTVPEAVEIVAVAAEAPQDEYLEYVAKETLRTLDPHWKRALASNEPIKFTTDAGKRYLLRHLSNDQLAKLEKTAPVCHELLARPGISDDLRRSAVQTLAHLDHTTELLVILGAIKSLDSDPQRTDASTVFDLVRQLSGRPPAELATARAELEKLATSARQSILRQVGFASLLSLDASADKASVWQLAAGTPRSLRDLLDAVPLVSDASIRAALYPRISELLTQTPAAWSAKQPRPVVGRFVRIELPKKGTLTLAEVEVISDGRNVARAGKATQKNTSSGGDASRAIDGNKNGEYGAGGQTHTEENTAAPWWEVDLGSDLPIESIAVYNRTDGDLGTRLNNFTVTVLDAERHETYRKADNPAPKPSSTFTLGEGDPALAIRHAAMLAMTQVRGQEVATFAALAPFVAKPADRASAIRALLRIPRNDWPKDQAQPLAQAMIAYLGALPAAQRTTPEALDAMEFGDRLAALLPGDLGKQTRAALDELGVRVIRVGTIFERMSYDQDVIAVRAGKPVEFLLENSDLMPHNFVIAEPGSLEELGQSAEATAQQPDAAKRNFVPQSKKVLLASTLLQPRATEKLSFVAPTKPGIYPFVCTYPGHWRRMYGALYVVEDLDAYLANPEAYVASHDLQIKDPLLADRRPRTEWKLDDLASAVTDLKPGHSYTHAKQLFQVATCVACHKLDGAGNSFGPDLTQLDAKLGPIDILKELLDPSARINEKFQAYTFELDSGTVVTGLVLEETPTSIKLIENPLAKAEPIDIKTAEIVQRKKSTTSLMPKGLLDKLTRDEILDLIAYISARGNAKHKLFQATDGHAGHH